MDADTWQPVTAAGLVATTVVSLFNRNDNDNDNNEMSTATSMPTLLLSTNDILRGVRVSLPYVRESQVVAALDALLEKSKVYVAAPDVWALT